MRQFICFVWAEIFRGTHLRASSRIRLEVASGLLLSRSEGRPGKMMPLLRSREKGWDRAEAEGLIHGNQRGWRLERIYQSHRIGQSVRLISWLWKPIFSTLLGSLSRLGYSRNCTDGHISLCWNCAAASLPERYVAVLHRNELGSPRGRRKKKYLKLCIILKHLIKGFMPLFEKINKVGPA